MNQILIALSVFLLTGCGSTILKTYKEDRNSLYKYDGAEVSYLNQGADAVIEGRVKDFEKKAKKVCGNRHPVVFVAKDIQQQESMMMPYEEKTTYNTTHTGNIHNNNYMNPASLNYSGNSSTTATTQKMRQVNYTSSNKHVLFYCKDEDVKQRSYRMKKTSNGPICVFSDKEIMEMEPGERRIRNVANDPSSTNCLKKEGWIRHITLQGSPATLFIGNKGLRTCKKIVEEIVDKQIDASKIGLWLRKKLRCK